jgi:hypothetical protein
LPSTIELAVVRKSSKKPNMFCFKSATDSAAVHQGDWQCTSGTSNQEPYLIEIMCSLGPLGALNMEFLAFKKGPFFGFPPSSP